LHPSETTSRLMARVLAYLINVQARLSFTKGLSVVEEPDIWVRELGDQLSLWIDVGEPAVDRIKKAMRLAQQVKVYSFNSKADLWWQQNQTKLAQLNAAIYRFNAANIVAFAELLDRTMSYSVTISGDSAFIATEKGECQVTWQVLQSNLNR